MSNAWIERKIEAQKEYQKICKRLYPIGLNLKEPRRRSALRDLIKLDKLDRERLLVIQKNPPKEQSETEPIQAEIGIA